MQKNYGAEYEIGSPRAARGLRRILPRVGTNEPPFIALLRHFLFPASATLALIVASLVFSQPLTRPYFIAGVLAFVLGWRLLGTTECNELKPSSQIEFFVPRVLFGWAKVVGVLLFIGFVAKSSDSYSRAVMMAWFVLTPLFYFVAHAATYRLLCRWQREGKLTRTHVIVGNNRLAREFAGRLERDPSLGTLIGFFGDPTPDDTQPVGPVNKLPREYFLGAITALPEYVRRNAIDVIHIAVPLDSQPELRQVLRELHDTTVSIYLLLDFPHDDHLQPRIIEMADTPMLAYCETPYCGLPGVTKRLVDVSVAGAALLVLWPVLLAIALCIRFDSRGPVIFKQRRYGLNGEEIAVYKFRTMTVCEDGDAIAQAHRGDARVTRIGQFLRRTSLDELPQLFCVLAGSMSLVGPRPHAVAHNEQYRRVIDGYMLRHKVQPGMTGWAQVNGARGATDTLEQMRLRVAYDLEYLRRWSPWIDIKILWRTIWLVIRDRNAY